MPPITVSWRVDIRQVGWGHSSSTSDPYHQALRPEGIKPSLPQSWPAATTAEEGKTTHTKTSSPRSKAPAPCSRFWGGSAVYAPLLLGYTDCCGSSGSSYWGRAVAIHSLPPTPHSCHSYPTRLPVLPPSQALPATGYGERLLFCSVLGRGALSRCQYPRDHGCHHGRLRATITEALFCSDLWKLIAGQLGCLGNR